MTELFSAHCPACYTCLCILLISTDYTKNHTDCLAHLYVKQMGDPQKNVLCFNYFGLIILSQLQIFYCCNVINKASLSYTLIMLIRFFQMQIDCLDKSVSKINTYPNNPDLKPF